MPKLNPLVRELRAVQRKYGQFDGLELLVPDLSGILKGKRIRPGDFEKYCDGFMFCGGVTLLNTLGETVAGIPYGEEDGDPDVPAVIVPGSFGPVPWASKPMGQALFNFIHEDGRPFFADPRNVLTHALQPLRKMGLQPVVATELEFYLFDAREMKRIGTPLVPGTNRVQPGYQVYHPDDLYGIEPLLDDIYAWADAQDIPAEAALSENAPGQFEINLHHVADPVLACDHSVLLKRIIKAAARKHGYIACFMAKPIFDQAGSGMHIHMSLLDRSGKNYFSHGRKSLAEPPFSKRLQHAVGGLIKLMPEATLLGAPNINSYRRLLPDNNVPVEPNWGVNHRMVAVRIPNADEKNLRFEYRTAGADCNPYLVMAGVAAAVHHGLKNKIDPGPFVPQGKEITPKLRVPNRWDAAIDKFARSKVLHDYLGNEYCKYYVMNRRAESDQYHNEISQRDFDWYLRGV